MKKYQDYCKAHDGKEEIFKITQKENKNLEDWVGGEILVNLQ